MKRDVINYAMLKSILSAYEMKKVTGGSSGPGCGGKSCTKKSDCSFDKPNCGCISGGTKYCYWRFIFEAIRCKKLFFTLILALFIHKVMKTDSAIDLFYTDWCTIALHYGI